MLKKLLILLIINFSIQSLAKADDIKDFEIEGMSIGDSLLDHYSEEEIKNPSGGMYKYEESDKFYHIGFKSSGKYNRLTVTVKKNDSSYKIYQVGGDITPMNIKDCHSLKKEIDLEILQMFKNKIHKDVDDFKTNIDKTGESIFYTIKYIFESKDIIVLQCKDYGKTIGYNDALLLDIASKEFQEWLTNEVYKY